MISIPNLLCQESAFNSGTDMTIQLCALRAHSQWALGFAFAIFSFGVLCPIIEKYIKQWCQFASDIAIASENAHCE